MAVAATSVLTLRCHSCSHAVGTSVLPLRLAALFKPSLVGRLTRSHTDEQRVRCGSCGWVNVFHPAKSSERIELK